MTTDLPPFSGSSVSCPKYGGRCSTEWLAPGWVSWAGTRGECLERQCTRCKYTWAEATVEQKTPVRETT